MIYRLIAKGRELWWQVAGRLLLWAKGVNVGPGCEFYGLPIVECYPGSTITIGRRVVLISDSRYTALGVNHPVVLRTLAKSAELHIGDDTGISGAAICAAEKVVIGRRVLIGANAMIFDTDFHARAWKGRRYNRDDSEIDKKAVNIGSDVFIGAQAIIAKGVHIGDGSIVGAGSVVVKNVAARQIVAGNPARERDSV